LFDFAVVVVVVGKRRGLEGRSQTPPGAMWDCQFLFKERKMGNNHSSQAEYAFI
jgi:hypothetical protein